jgi:hypothetical protein
MEEPSAQWPLIVRAVDMTSGPNDASLSDIANSSAAAVTIRLSDVTGYFHTLRLSSAAAVGLCVMLSNYPPARQTLVELVETRPFRTDPFAPAIEIYIEPEIEADRAKLRVALSELATDHAQFRFAIHESTGGAKLGAIDEQQLAVC